MRKLVAIFLAAVAALAVTVVPAGASNPLPPYPFAPNVPTLTVVPNPVLPNKTFRATATYFCPKVAVVFSLLSAAAPVPTVLVAPGTVLQTKSVTTNTKGAASYTFKGVAAGTYTVRAVQTKPSSGSLAKTCKVSITTSTTLIVEEDTIAPGPALNFAAVPQSSSAITLTWNAATGNPSTYEIKRSLVSGGSYPITVANVSATAARTYTNTGLSASTTYYYQIVAIDAAGNRSTPATAFATTFAASGIAVTAYPSSPNGKKVATINWTGNTGRVDIYRTIGASRTKLRTNASGSSYVDRPPSATIAAVYTVCPNRVTPGNELCGSAPVTWP